MVPFYTLSCWWFLSYLLCTKPQTSPHEATTHGLMTTCNITLSIAGGKIWKPKQCKLQPWAFNVLNYVVFLSLSVDKHSCHIIIGTCTYSHTLYLMTYPCLVWHSENYRICSAFQNYFLDFTHFLIIWNFMKSTAKHKRYVSLCTITQENTCPFTFPYLAEHSHNIIFYCILNSIISLFT